MPVKLTDKLRGFLRREEPAGSAAPEPPARPVRTCKKCGKSFSVDPSLGYVPNFCRDCKQQLLKEKEQKQRAAAAKEVRRKCKACGKFFTFPGDAVSYPTYCPACRRGRRDAMKEKYSRRKA